MGSTRATTQTARRAVAKALVPQLSRAKLTTLEQAFSERDLGSRADLRQHKCNINRRACVSCTQGRHTKTVREDSMDDTLRYESLLNRRGNDMLIGRPTGPIAHKQLVSPRRRRHTAAALPIAVSKRHILVDIEQQVRRRLLGENSVTIERRINAHAMISSINQMPAKLL